MRRRGFSHGDMETDVGALGAAIPDNVLAPIGAAPQVVHRPGILNAQLARYAVRLAVRPFLSREMKHVLA
jgi:hypothetical protein